MIQKENPFTGQGSGAKTIKQSEANSLPAQRQRILDYLHINGSITTIDTVWVVDINEQGKAHRVAKYILSVAGRPE